MTKLTTREKRKIQEVQKLRKFLQAESDRGCCLLAVSFLDNELKLLLEEKLVGEKKYKKELFDLNGPLGTFSSKINLSYSIGMLSKSLKNDINSIRKIRNEFGHNYTQIDFESSSIKDQILQLKHNIYEKNEKSSREMFINTVTLILSEIHELLEIYSPYKEMSNKKYLDESAYVKILKEAIDIVYNDSDINEDQ